MPLGPGREQGDGPGRSASLTDRALALRAWLEEPGRLRRLLRVALPLLLLAALFLPPFSLFTRLTTLDFTPLDPGREAIAGAPGGPGAFVVPGRAISRPARLRLRRDNGAADRLPGLPAGHTALSDLFRLDLVGPAPRTGALDLSVQVGEGDHPFVDAYGWDGQRWRWLSPQFYGTDRLRVTVPMARFLPRYLVVTRAEEAATEVSAVLLPPPAAVPAAMAELPILELGGYHLGADDGTVTGRRFAIPSRSARVYGVIDNLEAGRRVRSDLVNNLLILPESRRRHRQAIVDLVRRDRLDGVVLDYRGIDSDLQPVYAGLLGRLAEDLRAQGAELVVTVPMPHRSSGGWDASPYNWQELGAAADGLRVALPNDQPLEIEALDSLVRWALPSVERGRLQLALPVRGRDVAEDGTTLIGFGEALAKILDLAGADAPDRISPGAATTAELPTMRRAGLARDPATGMWRFSYWDGNRREHTVWLNDAAGLQPALAIAGRYRLGRVALDGVSAGLDPGLWRMVKGFIADGKAVAPSTDYRLQWQLADGSGRVVQQAVQPLQEASFDFRAPPEQGSYRLSANLVTAGDRLAAMGQAREVQVAPPPPPTPRATEVVILIEPTPETVSTAPPPRDELAAARRTPVRIGEAAPTKAADYNAVVAFADGPMRAEPSFGARTVTDLRVGDLLQVLAVTPDGGWLRAIHPPTGIEGWVREELVELQVPIEAIGRVASPGPPATGGTPAPPRATRPPGSRG